MECKKENNNLKKNAKKKKEKELIEKFGDYFEVDVIQDILEASNKNGKNPEDLLNEIKNLYLKSKNNKNASTKEQTPKKSKCKITLEQNTVNKTASATFTSKAQTLPKPTNLDPISVTSSAPPLKNPTPPLINNNPQLMNNIPPLMNINPLMNNIPSLMNINPLISNIPLLMNNNPLINNIPRLLNNVPPPMNNLFNYTQTTAPFVNSNANAFNTNVRQSFQPIHQVQTPIQNFYQSQLSAHSNLNYLPNVVQFNNFSNPVYHSNPISNQQQNKFKTGEKLYYNNAPSETNSVKSETSSVKSETSSVKSAQQKKPIENFSSKKDHFQYVIDKINSGIKVLVLLRGLPGSGKSFMADVIYNKTVNIPFNRQEYHIYSSDNYFYLNKNIEYRYDVSQLSQAHIWNQRRVMDGMKLGISPIIIDNTNIQLWEMHFYIINGIKNGYLLEVLEPHNSWSLDEKQLVHRNSHNVPLEKIQAMKKNYQKHLTIQQIVNHFEINYVQLENKRLFPPIINQNIVANENNKKNDENDETCCNEENDRTNTNNVLSNQQNKKNDKKSLSNDKTKNESNPNNDELEMETKQQNDKTITKNVTNQQNVESRIESKQILINKDKIQKENDNIGPIAHVFLFNKNELIDLLKEKLINEKIFKNINELINHFVDKDDDDDDNNEVNFDDLTYCSDDKNHINDLIIDYIDNTIDKLNKYKICSNNYNSNDIYYCLKKFIEKCEWFDLDVKRLRLILNDDDDIVCLISRDDILNLFGKSNLIDNMLATFDRVYCLQTNLKLTNDSYFFEKRKLRECLRNPLRKVVCEMYRTNLNREISPKVQQLLCDKTNLEFDKTSIEYLSKNKLSKNEKYLPGCFRSFNNLNLIIAIREVEKLSNQSYRYNRDELLNMLYDETAREMINKNFERSIHKKDNNLKFESNQVSNSKNLINATKINDCEIVNEKLKNKVKKTNAQSWLSNFFKSSKSLSLIEKINKEQKLANETNENYRYSRDELLNVLDESSRQKIDKILKNTEISNDLKNVKNFEMKNDKQVETNEFENKIVKNDTNTFFEKTNEQSELVNCVKSLKHLSLIEMNKNEQNLTNESYRYSRDELLNVLDETSRQKIDKMLKKSEISNDSKNVEMENNDKQIETNECENKIIKNDTNTFFEKTNEQSALVNCVKSLKDLSLIEMNKNEKKLPIETNKCEFSIQNFENDTTNENLIDKNVLDSKPECDVNNLAEIANEKVDLLIDNKTVDGTITVLNEDLVKTVSINHIFHDENEAENRIEVTYKNCKVIDHDNSTEFIKNKEINESKNVSNNLKDLIVDKVTTRVDLTEVEKMSNLDDYEIVNETIDTKMNENFKNIETIVKENLNKNKDTDSSSEESVYNEALDDISNDCESQIVNNKNMLLSKLSGFFSKFTRQNSKENVVEKKTEIDNDELMRNNDKDKKILNDKNIETDELINVENIEIVNIDTKLLDVKFNNLEIGKDCLLRNELSCLDDEIHQIDDENNDMKNNKNANSNNLIVDQKLILSNFDKKSNNFDNFNLIGNHFKKDEMNNCEIDDKHLKISDKNFYDKKGGSNDDDNKLPESLNLNLEKDERTFSLSENDFYQKSIENKNIYCQMEQALSNDKKMSNKVDISVIECEQNDDSKITKFGILNELNNDERHRESCQQTEEETKKIIYPQLDKILINNCSNDLVDLFKNAKSLFPNRSDDDINYSIEFCDFDFDKTIDMLVNFDEYVRLGVINKQKNKSRMSPKKVIQIHESQGAIKKNMDFIKNRLAQINQKATSTHEDEHATSLETKGGDMRKSLENNVWSSEQIEASQGAIKKNMEIVKFNEDVTFGRQTKSVETYKSVDKSHEAVVNMARAKNQVVNKDSELNKQKEEKHQSNDYLINFRNLNKKSNSTKSRSPSVKKSEDDDKVELPLGEQGVKFLEKLFGEPDSSNQVNLKSVIKISKKLAKDLYILWLESINEQINTNVNNSQHDENTEMLSKDKLLIKQIEQDLRQSPSNINHVKTIDEIIDMETALVIAKSSDKKQWTSENVQNLSNSLKLKRLKKMFPDFKRNVIKEFLEHNDYNFNVVFELLSFSQEPKQVISSEHYFEEIINKNNILAANDSSSSTINLLPAQENYLINQVKNQKLPNQNDCDDSFEEINEQSLYDFENANEENVQKSKEEQLNYFKNLAVHYRDQAQTELEQRRILIEKASKYHSSRTLYVAQYYYELAEIHKKRANNANKFAVQAIVNAQLQDDNPTTLDLHQLHVSEAIQALNLFLDNHINMLRKNHKSSSYVCIVTGRGVNSVNKKPKIKPAVIRHIQNARHLDFRLINDGLLEIKINSTDLLSSS